MLNLMHYHLVLADGRPGGDGGGGRILRVDGHQALQLLPRGRGGDARRPPAAPHPQAPGGAPDLAERDAAALGHLVDSFRNTLVNTLVDAFVNSHFSLVTNRKSVL